MRLRDYLGVALMLGMMLAAAILALGLAQP